MKGHSSSKTRIKNLIPLFAVLALLGLAMFIYTFTLPTMVNENHVENVIHIKTDYKLIEKVPPNLLYPNGTTLYPDTTLTSSLSNTFLINEKITVTSDKPVEIKASSNPTLNIENKGIWNKDYPIGEKKTFNTKGSNYTLNLDMVIPAKELFSYLDQVEAKLNMHSNQYIFHVSPELKGNITYQGATIGFGGDGGLDFDRNQNELTLQDNEKLSNVKSYPIKSFINRTNKVFFIPVKIARGLFFIVTLLFALIWYFYRNKVDQREAEYVVIDRKYEKLLIDVRENIDLKNTSEIVLLSFKDLLLVSDEKETPICRYENEHEVNYFVADHQFVYSYTLPIEGRSRKR